MTTDPGCDPGLNPVAVGADPETMADEPDRQSNDPNSSLWTDYAEQRTVENRNRLVLVYSPLVKWVVGRLSPELRKRADPEDLVSYGLMGLIDAVERFDSTPGFKFQTYAVARIRGAVIDQLRQLDRLPRQVRSRARHLSEVRSDLEHRLGRHASRPELAAAAGMTLGALEAVEMHVATAPVSLEGDSEHETDPGYEDQRFEEVLETLDGELAVRRLRAALAELPERERSVVTLYYLEGLRLAEVGEILGVTESRVSQLRSQAVSHLRALLDASPASRPEAGWASVPAS